MKNKFNRKNSDSIISAFKAILPHEAVKIIDQERYELMLSKALELEKLLSAEYESGEIKADVNEIFNIGSISTELPDLSITDTKAFSQIISAANNFEIYPLKNGNLRLDITFQSVLRTIKEEK